MHLEAVGQLDAGQVQAVTTLVRRAEAVDHVAPLSEQVLLATREGSRTDAANGPVHFLAYDGTHLAGYAHLERGLAPEAASDESVATIAETAGASSTGSGASATAEVVVDPADRRHGVATELIRAMRDALWPRADNLRIWSHGHLDGARALAARSGYLVVRELWSMRRPLLPDDGSLPPVALPDGFAARDFIVGQDEDAWLRVNARAFANHAEQGRLTRHDLDLRIAEPWFDPTGFILIEDTRGANPVLAASHWTKIVPSTRPRVRPTKGEVYVVGVDPAYQGLGLGRAVTVLGLEHLRERGVTEAMLYVDADNMAAIATYSRLGFTRFAVDVMYSPAVQPQVPR
jgi:mycothiol synthase